MTIVPPTGPTPVMRRSITPQQMEEVLRRYTLGTLTATPETAGGTANLNVKLTTTCGVFFLRRRNPKYAAESYVAFDHALMEHLARYGIGTPLAFPARSGERWVRLGEDVFELYPFRSGNAHDCYSARQAAAAGRALAAFHRAVRNFPAPSGKEWPRYDDPRQIREGVEEMCAELKQRIPENALGYLSGQVAMIESGLPDSLYYSLPRRVVHGDYHPGNLKFLDNKVSGIFDLDWATVQPRVRDLADGLIFFAGERDADIDPADIRSLTQTWRPSPDRMRLFMEAYRALETLEPEEKEILPLFMKARWMHCRVNGRSKVPETERSDFFIGGLLAPLHALDMLEHLF